MKRRSLYLAAAALCIAAPALGDEGRIPLAGPAVITTPGHYIVTRSFAAPPVGHAILIRANDVVVDLNGQLLTQSAISREVIAIDLDYVTRGIVIRNGSLSGGQAGIGTITTDVSGTELADLSVEKVEISGSRYGVSVAALAVEVISCHIHDVIFGGITLGGSATGIVARIVDNVIVGPGGVGISLFAGRASEIRGNKVTGFTPSAAAAGSGAITVMSAGGVSASGGHLVEANQVTLPAGATGDGIALVTSGFGGEVGPANLVLRNVVRGAGRFGIYSYLNNTRIEGNVVSNSMSDGIHVGNAGAFGPPLAGFYNVVVANQVAANGGCGVTFGNTNFHMYRDNFAPGNGGGGYCDPGFPNILGPLNF